MLSSAPARNVRRTSLLFTAIAAASFVACAPNEAPAASTGTTGSTASGATPTSATPTSSARFVDPTRLSEAPTRCAREVAPTGNGTARFERPDAGGAWTLVMTVAPLDGGSFDAARKAHAFGSVEGEPTIAMDNGRLVVRTAVKFTGDPVATVVVGVQCGGETGLVSVGVRWSDANLDSGTPFEAQIAAVGGT